MTNPPEIFDVVDDADRVIGQALRAEVHRRALKHRAIHIWVFNPAAELFVQHRAATKDTFSNCYDSSASGHLDHGEDYDQAAVRELHEELGLALAPHQLTKLFRVEAAPETGWEFVWVYRVQGAYQPVINLSEIQAGRFWSAAELAQLIAQHPAQCAPSFVRIWHEFQRRQLWPESLH